MRGDPKTIFTPDVAKPYRSPQAGTLYELLKSHAHVGPERVAILAPGRRPLSYACLLSQVERTIEALRTLGLGRNDRVAVVLPNGPEMAVAFVAVAAGATCAPLNPAYHSGEFAFYLADLNAKALIIWSKMDSPARDIARQRGIPVIELTPEVEAAGAFRLVSMVQGPPARGGFAQVEDTALVLHTSGTTSRPKIVPLTQANICSSGHHISVTLELKETDRCLNVMPLFHIHGLIGAVLASLVAGTSVVCTPGFDADLFFEWMDTFEVTWYTAVPTIHQAVLARASANREIIACHPLRFIRSSSAALPQRVLTELEDVFSTRVIESYGMTEASHQMTSNPLAPALRKPGSVGMAAGPDVAIMDEAGNLLPIGEVGEVVIRGPNVTRGYENNAAANQSSITGGWFRTGDQGRFDHNGYLYLTGRLKEIINRGGEKVAPKEVDEILSQHPAVSQAITFGVPHPTLGEDVAAAVVLKTNATVAESDIIEFCAARLANIKVPNQLLIVDEIPKGPTGKLQRIGLADTLADQLASKSRTNFVAAETSTEKQLADIWKNVLKVDHVGVRDNFYALGGDSLSMVVMMADVEGRFGEPIPLDSFLKAPTIETIVEHLQPKAWSTYQTSTTAANLKYTKPIRDSVLIGVKNRLLQLLALYVPGMKTTRVWLHRMRGVSIGSNVSIGLSTIIETAYPRLVFIGNNISIGMRVVISGHLRDSTTRARAIGQHTVRIEDDVYIGPSVIILPNVTIGQGAVVSAGSVVFRSVPAHTLVRGNPAVPIAYCGLPLGRNVSFQEFLRHLKPIRDDAPLTPTPE
jgi:acyl-CoA synthetase (AMP-forming)/AMP-acid ligase II/acetyltransferase-like isoleucine patch superfamily enzyme/acyl carrier protein